MDTAALVSQNPSEKPNTSNLTDGDHDSGVDESTQRKDGPTTNGVLTSPLKSPSKIPAPKKLSTLPSPTKSTKGSPKTPEAPPTADKKKVPMNKIQVGAAPSPNLKTVKSKIGSLQNATHKPGGGNVKIENRKLDWKAETRIAAKNDAYQPGGGDKKIPQVKLKWEAKPKVGSLDNATHKPGGGEKKIESVKLDFKDKAKPKVGSKDNLKHQPGGGNVKIEDQKLDIKAQSKIGSLDNVKHKPGGGERKIFDDKDYLRQMSGSTSRAASEGIPSGTQDGWSSASTSRRTSRDRRTSGDRRYRSESRLGLRTPEIMTGISPKEEHCSLWEKHDRENKTSSMTKAISPSKESVPINNSEDKDLNSNKPLKTPPTIDETMPKSNISSDSTDKKTESELSGVSQFEHQILSDNKNDVPELMKVGSKQNGKDKEEKGETFESGLTNSTKTNKEDNKDPDKEKLKNKTDEIQNIQKRPESKEDLVREIKEIDSKEVITNKNSLSNPPSTVNNQPQQVVDSGSDTNINVPIHESKTDES